MSNYCTLTFFTIQLCVQSVTTKSVTLYRLTATVHTDISIHIITALKAAATTSDNE